MVPSTDGAGSPPGVDIDGPLALMGGADMSSARTPPKHSKVTTRPPRLTRFMFMPPSPFPDPHPIGLGAFDRAKASLLFFGRKNCRN
jgi:hypothetical protein